MTVGVPAHSFRLLPEVFQNALGLDMQYEIGACPNIAKKEAEKN